MGMTKTMHIAEFGGLEVQGAYISITDVFVRYASDVTLDENDHPVVSNKRWEFECQVMIHKDRDAKVLNRRPLARERFAGEFPATAEVNALVWIYTELRKDPRFAGAVDVIE